MPADALHRGRVAMLAHTYYLRDPRVRRAAEALASAGVDVHAICLAERGQPRRATVNGVQVHRLPVSRRRGGPLRYFYEYLMVGVLGALVLAWLHFRLRLDVVHVHNM